MHSGFRNRIPAIGGIMFVLTAVTAVAAAWSAGRHLYDLSPSFSLYVGIFRYTSVLYFIAAAVMVTLLSVYIAGIKLPLTKRVVYVGVFLCIFGTALFPCNAYSDAPTVFTIRLHNYFAIGLLLLTVVTFLLTVILSKHKKQRAIAVISLGYTSAFAVLYFTGFKPLFQSFFIWENLAIVLLLVGLHAEQYGGAKETPQTV